VATPGRNDPCPCGSGRRYKACHGALDAALRIVDFVVAGTQKGGTSALDTYLREHPQVCVPRTIKETHYFDDETIFAAGDAGDAAAYHRHFAPRAAHRIVGEATPIYMYWEPVAARIHAYNPAMKFIVLLRHPAARAHSQWNMESRRGNEPLSFEDAIRAEKARLAAAPRGQVRNWSYVDRGYYSRQLERLWQRFPRESTLVLKSESFQRDPAPALATIAAFLGVDPFPRSTPREVFSAPYAQPMGDAAASMLRDAYAAEIDALESLLGWDLADWKKPATA
jgi:Sulfotransferase domain/SEC-C motif